ncbi:MAG: R-SNARE protein, VAMP72-family [Monoraphidium minutum]|nr:MAG: R-SNARE protein, VAMP72-family [Monoraphidium minutum]
MLIFALVARRDGTVLAEHQASKGNVSEVASRCLQHAISSPDARLTITVDRHTFNFYKPSDDWIYLSVADEAFGRQIPFHYNERIAEAWQRDFAARAARAAPRSFSRSFGPRLKEQMDYLNAHPETINRVAAVQRKVDDVKTMMLENLDKVVLRGERLQLLVEATEDLEASAAQFQKQGRALRNDMWWQGAKVKAVVFSSLFLIIAVIIVLLACFGGANRCVPKRGGGDQSQ